MPDVFVAEPEETPAQPHETPVKKVSPKKETKNGNTPSLFMTYCRYPEGVSFENQEKDEKIILFLRRHFITNLRWISTMFFFFFFPVVAILALEYAGIVFSLPFRYVLILTSFYYLVIFGYALIQFVIWFYNVGIVTPLRVIDIDISHITSKNVAATGISDIVDVEYSQKGFLSSFLDYGDIHMQTEGIKPNFEFTTIPHPATVSDTISDLIGGRELNE